MSIVALANVVVISEDEFNRYIITAFGFFDKKNIKLNTEKLKGRAFVPCRVSFFRMHRQLC